jgi:hypothetical protein
VWIVLVDLLKQVIHEECPSLTDEDQEKLAQRLADTVEECWVMVPLSHSLATHLAWDLERLRVRGQKFL